MFKNLLKFCGVILTLLFSEHGHTQDPHYSQAFSAPLTINPATAGLIDGSYRLSAIYRDQWRAILDRPLTAYTAGGDVRFDMGGDNSGFPDFLGVGLQFSSDRIGLFDFNTTQIGLTGAYHKSIDARQSKYLSAGISMNMVQKNVNYENLNFQDEFNGVNGFDLPGSDLLPPNNFGYGDFGLGIHYSMTSGDYWNLFAGVALHHIAAPNVSFYRNITNIDLNEVNIPIFRKWVYHVSAIYRYNDQFHLIPRAMYLAQGEHKIAQFGTNLRLQKSSSYGSAIQLGAWIRAVKNVENWGVESLVLLFAMEFNSLQLGLSYDANLNDLTKDFKGQGVFEFSINYIGQYENETNYCPEF